MRAESGGAQAAGRRPSLHGVGGRCDSTPPLSKAEGKAERRNAGGGWVSERTPWAHLDFANPPPTRNAANCSLERLWHSDRWELWFLGWGRGAGLGQGPLCSSAVPRETPGFLPGPRAQCHPAPSPPAPKVTPKPAWGGGGAATGPGRRVHCPRGPGGAVAVAGGPAFIPAAEPEKAWGRLYPGQSPERAPEKY